MYVALMHAQNFYEPHEASSSARYDYVESTLGEADKLELDE
jgi:hypothetical protein